MLWQLAQMLINDSLFRRILRARWRYDGIDEIRRPDNDSRGHRRKVRRPRPIRCVRPWRAPFSLRFKISRVEGRSENETTQGANKERQMRAPRITQSAYI